MATKDISDLDVCRAVRASKQHGAPNALERLELNTGQHQKVCYRAMERALARDLIEYGVSLPWAWLTDKGEALVEANK